jgi:hypothetical protein
MAQEGIIGLRKVRDANIPWDIEYLGWVEGEPTRDFIMREWGVGNYFVLKSCQPTPHQIFPIGEPHDGTWQHLQDGASVMRKISIIFRVKMPWM